MINGNLRRQPGQKDVSFGQNRIPEISLYPSPATLGDSIQIDTAKFDAGQVQIDVYNADGKHVFSQTFQANEKGCIPSKVLKLNPGWGTGEYKVVAKGKTWKGDVSVACLVRVAKGE